MTLESMQRPQFEIAGVFSATFGAIGRNIVPFGALALLFVTIPQALIAWVGQEDGMVAATLGPSAKVALQIGSVVIGAIFSWILQAAVIQGSVDDLNGRKASLGACLTTAFRNLLPVFLISLLMALGLMLGFILLVVPGLILMIVWCVTIPAQVVEQRGVLASFDRSRELTRGSRWSIFGLFVLYIVLSWIVAAVFLAVGAAVSGSLTGIATNQVMQLFISPVVSGASSLIGAVGTAAIYYELRVAREGIGPAALAAVFD
jgi:hypothetical protein